MTNLYLWYNGKKSNNQIVATLDITNESADRPDEIDGFSINSSAYWLLFIITTSYARR